MTLVTQEHRHDPLMLDMRLYHNRERYPDDGPVLRHRSPEDARYLRFAMGNAGLWHMETMMRRDAAAGIMRKIVPGECAIHKRDVLAEGS